MATLAIGDKAPDFALLDQDGEKRTMKEFYGRKVLLYVYPKANTPGCTTQSCEVSAAQDDFSTLNTAVLGMSPDLPEKQKAFDEKHSLRFPLLSDPDHAVAEAYGVWGEKSMYGNTYMGIIRSAFLIDEKGILAGVWYKISPKKTVPEAMKVLA